MTKFPLEISTNVLSNQTQQTISARELHEFIRVKQDFTPWIKGRIKEYNFEKGQDFIISRKKADFQITFDMAKSLCMIEKNGYGRKARKYLIECEKKLKTPLRPSSPEPDPEMQQITVEHFAQYMWLILMTGLTRH